jgi:acetylornithine deacetylase
VKLQFIKKIDFSEFRILQHSSILSFKMDKIQLYNEAIDLLKRLISTPSMSGEESKTSDLIESYIVSKGLTPKRKLNNIWISSTQFDPQKPTILLNSHHDTVKPVTGWTKDPFLPEIGENELLSGLGSNDAGASLVSLLAVFLFFEQEKSLNFNLIYSATAEEEIQGKNGIECILTELGEITLGIVGEPTGMQMAVAEKGIMVLDCKAKGTAGHAARNEGDNAIYHALEDIYWFKNYHFPRVSPLLGEIKMTVTQIQAGSRHNVIPDECTFVVDVRMTDEYAHQEVFEIIQSSIKSEVKARSFRIKPSSISIEHPIVKAGMELGLNYYISPTTSDRALMNFTTLKIGPGDSARSHTANEYIYLHEIANAIDIYINLFKKYNAYE